MELGRHRFMSARLTQDIVLFLQVDLPVAPLHGKDVFAHVGDKPFAVGHIILSILPLLAGDLPLSTARFVTDRPGRSPLIVQEIKAYLKLVNEKAGGFGSSTNDFLYWPIAPWVTKKP